MHPEKSPKAYSYLRFSTPEQRLGASMRRQITAADDYARDVLKLPIHQRFNDLGISGRKLRNVSHGALGAFLTQIRSGAITPGSVLIVESLNRLTRSEPLDAFDLLREIIRAGIEVVTLHDQKRYNTASMREIASLIQALVLMCNSWQESENKSFWCADAWAKKREAAAKLRRPITRAIPTWLSVTGVKQQAGKLDWSDAKFTVIKERAALIRDIFKKRVQGCGLQSIATWINNQDIPPWGSNRRKTHGGWNHVYISNILHSRAVLGEFQPYKLSEGRYSAPIAARGPIPNYFPRIVPDDLWLAAQYFNGKPKQHPGRPSLALSAGLAIDPDGAPMYLGHHSKNQRYLATSFSFRHENKTIWRWQLAHLEQCLLLIVQKINWQKALSNPDDEPQLLKLRGQLGEIAQQEQTIKTRLQHAAKILLTDLGALNDEIKTQAVALTSQQALLSEKHRETIHKINQLEVSTKPPLEITKFSLEDFQKNNLTPEVREQFRRQLRNLLKKITLYPDGNIPGFPTNAIRIKAASHASGTSGRLPKPEERIFGAIRLLTVSNQDLIFWVTYPAIITKNQVPVILATYGEDSFLKK